MAQHVIDLSCPNCAAPVSTEQKKCKYCGSPITITSFNSISEMTMPMINKYAGTYKKALNEDPENQEINFSLATCYLKLKNYDKALECFEKAMEDNFDNSETFFYAAVCLLSGKKAFLHQRPTIDKALEYINAALMIETRGIYYYFMAYIKQDYFARKFLKTSPNYKEVLAMAFDAGVSESDVNSLFALLGVDIPAELK